MTLCFYSEVKQLFGITWLAGEHQRIYLDVRSVFN